ncbi:MAG: hypothetical protein LBE33_06050 [Zoogloeaceae bacterium]|jgi:hypothetical protein|nr:hypothetical protein [Zoogloeaceae bacterium]
MKFTLPSMLAALFAATLALPPAALSAEPPAPGKSAPRDDSAMKERLIAHIDARIRILETAKSCVRAARDMNATLACYAEERRQTKALRERDRGNW